jgi:hypothetical protein
MRYSTPAQNDAEDASMLSMRRAKPGSLARNCSSCAGGADVFPFASLTEYVAPRGPARTVIVELRPTIWTISGCDAGGGVFVISCPFSACEPLFAAVQPQAAIASITRRGANVKTLRHILHCIGKSRGE